MMQENQTPKNEQKPAEVTVQKQYKPNESGSIAIDGFVRVFDPNTKEVFVETRT